MAEQPPSPADSHLNPSAPSFTMPSSSSTTETSQPTSNGQPRQPKEKRPSTKPNPAAESTGDPGAGEKLTGAQLKKQKAAEKAARRAEKVAERGAEAQTQPTPSGQQQGPIQARESQERQRRVSTVAKDGVAGPSGATTSAEGHRRAGSTNVRLPIRGSQTQQQQHAQQAPGGDKTTVVKDKALDKRLPMLSHLYPSSSARRATLVTADRQIHPAVLSLGVQLRDYVICGSNARTVATLLVFKKVIQNYDTPSGVALSRDLTRHLSHQISHLSQSRQLCVAQGNSIRWLKKLITLLDPDLADTEAKAFLCRAIDTFIREKISLADEVIASQATARLEDEGEVILTYGKSSVVEKTLLQAFEAGKKFKVIVVDSRPLFEGKNLARSLLRAGLPNVQYCLLSGLADVVEQEGVTKCFLGASAMLGNGRLSSRAGTALVAMMAKEANSVRGRGKVPVIVLCESVKFTAKVALDSLSMNEVADADMLVHRDPSDTLSESTADPKQDHQQQQPPSSSKKGGGKPGGNDNEEPQKEKRGLDGWKEKPNLYLVDLMYDVTPTQYLDMVISEQGVLPPNAVPVVNGVHGGDE